MALIQKSFSDIITFSRTSNATRVGPTGVLEYAPHNLALRSEEFDNAYWSKDQSSIVANSVAAPNGTVTADKIVEDTATQSHGIYRLGLTVTSGLTYTWSVYAKKAERTWIILSAGGGTNNSAWFNLNTGAAGTIQSGVAAATITSVGNDWYRCSVTRTVSSGSANFECYASTADNTASYTGDGTSGIYIWGAQLSVGPYALDYTPTTSAAVYGPRFDYDGSGVTIVEPVSTNLFTYSEQLNNVIWSTAGNVTITANAAVAPDGTTTADTMTEVATNATHRIEYITSGTSVANQYTVSFYVKVASGAPWFRLSFTDSSGAHQVNAWFDLTNGVNGSTSVVGSGVVASRSITAVGNGWYRCVMTGTVTGGTGVVYSYNALANADLAITYLGSTSRAVYLWGAQLEVGSTATAYMVSGASNGFRAVPVVSGSATPKGLLVEEQRQNLLQYSEQFDNAYWTKSNTTVSANATTSPDGTVNADLLTATSNSEDIYVILSKSASAITYTLSVFVKNNVNANTVVLYLSDNSTGQATGNFDLSAVTATTTSGTWSGVSASISSVGSGWFRCTLTATSPATSGLLPGFNWGSSGAAAYFWGAQLESSASFASSYIPTLASAVTRTADVASVNTLSPWFNATEGTMYGEGSLIGSPLLFMPHIDDGTNDNRFICGIGQGSSDQYVISSGVTQAQISLSGVSQNQVAKVAMAYKVNDIAASLNGGTVGTDTSATIPAVTTLRIGSNAASVFSNGHIRRIAFFPRRLSNAELQALTA